MSIWAKLSQTSSIFWMHICGELLADTAEILEYTEKANNINFTEYHDYLWDHCSSRPVSGYNFKQLTFRCRLGPNAHECVCPLSWLPFHLKSILSRDDEKEKRKRESFCRCCITTLDIRSNPDIKNHIRSKQISTS